MNILQVYLLIADLVVLCTTEMRAQYRCLFPEEGTTFDFVIKTFFAPPFILTFFLYRVFLWWPVSFQLYQDSMKVWKKANELRPGKSWVLGLFLACNLPLGLLQLFWSKMIVEEVYKVIVGAS